MCAIIGTVGAGTMLLDEEYSSYADFDSPQRLGRNSEP